jgi:hypothetical protein
MPKFVKWTLKQLVLGICACLVGYQAFACACSELNNPENGCTGDCCQARPDGCLCYDRGAGGCPS